MAQNQTLVKASGLTFTEFRFGGEVIIWLLQKSIPYDGAKPMYLVGDVDNKEALKEIILDTYTSLIKK